MPVFQFTLKTSALGIMSRWMLAGNLCQQSWVWSWSMDIKRLFAPFYCHNDVACLFSCQSMCCCLSVLSICLSVSLSVIVSLSLLFISVYLSAISVFVFLVVCFCCLSLFVVCYLCLSVGCVSLLPVCNVMCVCMCTYASVFVCV